MGRWHCGEDPECCVVEAGGLWALQVVLEHGRPHQPWGHRPPRDEGLSSDLPRTLADSGAGSPTFPFPGFKLPEAHLSEIYSPKPPDLLKPQAEEEGERLASQ